MLVSRRIAELQQLEKQLRRIVNEEFIRHRVAPSRHHGDSSLQEELRKYAALKDKLLFRRVPVALSLLERSLLPVLRDGKKSLLSFTDDNRVEFLERLMGVTVKRSQHDIALVRCGNNKVGYEHEQQEPREEHEGDKERGREPVAGATSVTTPQQRILVHPGHMVRLFCSLHFLEQERRKLYRHHLSRLKLKLQSAQQTLSRAQKRKDGAPTLQVARQTLSEAKCDVALLQSSLLSRSYLSARLWRFLLREEVWLAAVRRLGGQEVVTPHSLHVMLLSVTRLSFGILQDVVQGHVLNTRAPRFVMSIPSRKVRRYITRVNASQGRRGRGSDPLPSPALATATLPTNVDKLPGVATTAEAKTSAKQGERVSSEPKPIPKVTEAESPRGNCGEEIIKLRWLPPSSSHDAIPMVLETLAMCSFIIPALDTAEIARAGEMLELFEFLSALQATASSVLALGTHAGVEEAKMHRTLRRLEDVMLDCGTKAKAALVTQTNDVFPALPPIKAARLLLGLDSMHLIHTKEVASQELLGKLVISMFPQLSTCTQRSLLEKSRLNSLFAFATRSHRARLYREHSSWRGAESALVESVRARARLQQRQMQAALRGKYLEEVNNRSVGQLAESLPVYSLVALFYLLARAARDAPRKVPETQGRLITASLFVAEGVCVAGANASSSMDTVLQPYELPTLLKSLGVLWPLVTAQYQILQHSSNNSLRGPSRGNVKDSVAKSELLLVSCITDMVFTATNAAMARRVQQAEAAIHPMEEEDEWEDVGDLLSVNDVIAIVSALSEWCSFTHMGGSGGISNNAGKCATYVSTAGSLIKRLLLADVELWRHVRQLNELQRDQFVCTLSDIMQQLNMMDAAVTQAVSAIR